MKSKLNVFNSIRLNATTMQLQRYTVYISMGKVSFFFFATLSISFSFRQCTVVSFCLISFHSFAHSIWLYWLVFNWLLLLSLCQCFYHWAHIVILFLELLYNVHRLCVYVMWILNTKTKRNRVKKDNTEARQKKRNNHHPEMHMSFSLRSSAMSRNAAK